jgi:hypothetical protein
VHALTLYCIQCTLVTDSAALCVLQVMLVLMSLSSSPTATTAATDATAPNGGEALQSEQPKDQLRLSSPTAPSEQPHVAVQASPLSPALAPPTMPNPPPWLSPPAPTTAALPPPITPPPISPPPLRPDGALSPELCSAFFHDPNHRFHQMWAPRAWHVREGASGAACWDEWGSGARYFSDVFEGRYCDKNWFAGNAGRLGDKYGGPTDTKAKASVHFMKAAPALLGFDHSIDWYCQANGGYGTHAEACVRANANILSLYGDWVPYNMCRNVEWTACAARGKLPGQGGKTIRFAYAPMNMNALHGEPHIGSCGGYVPPRSHSALPPTCIQCTLVHSVPSTP